MKKQKSFDCVRMKGDIQRKLAEEMAGMPELEKRRVQLERIKNNPILGPFVERLARDRKSSVTDQGK